MTKLIDIKDQESFLKLFKLNKDLIDCQGSKIKLVKIPKYYNNNNEDHYFILEPKENHLHPVNVYLNQDPELITRNL